MPRFFDPERYNEDWYIELRGELQKFFDYIIEMCDNAGVWKPNKITFETKTGFKINLDSFLKRVNGDKERILVLDNGRWFLPGFIQVQWFNKDSFFDLNPKNRFHSHIIKLLDNNNISRGLVRGLKGVLTPPIDIDMDKVKDNSGMYSGKSFYPGEFDLNLELPEMKLGIVIQWFTISKRQTVTESDVGDLWIVFKQQYFTGKKWYGDVSDVYSHFINWSKNQTIGKGKPSNVEKLKNARELIERQNATTGKGC